MLLAPPKAQRDKIAIMKKIIEELEQSTPKGAPEEEIFRMAEEQGIKRDRAKSILNKMKE